jgi:hypothetical protein
MMIFHLNLYGSLVCGKLLKKMVCIRDKGRTFTFWRGTSPGHFETRPTNITI